MFFRQKRSSGHTYLQIVENAWSDGKPRQRVIATVGRLDKLQESGHLEALLQSGLRFCDDNNSYFSATPADASLSTFQLSQVLGVSPSTIVAWTNQGRLRAHRTPGGHRRVRVKDVREFLSRSRQAGARVARVLVVDDDPQVIRAIARMLRPHADRIKVEGCTNGIEALVTIGLSPPQLVLLDVYMAGIDGFEVCRRLRQVAALGQLKIVAITAHPEESDRSRILEGGALDYWVKPVSVEQILSVLPLVPGPGISQEVSEVVEPDAT